jgi:hypothetical protein
MNRTYFALSALTILGTAVLPSVSSAAAPEKTAGFVCPVLSVTVGAHNPNAITIADGDYSLIPSGTPHTIMVPVTATNADGDGAPGGAHASPGDRDYTAIWAS